MKKILLTGFVPFLKNKINPTEEIVRELDGELIGEYVIHSAVFPVDFTEAGVELQRQIELVQPDVIVSLGLAQGRTRITPERIAINVSDGPADNAGVKLQDAEIIPGGADGLFTTLPVRKMVDALKKQELPAAISNTAGTYVCNNVMYQALDHARRQDSSVLAGFIHLPASHALAMELGNTASWSMADLVKGVRICLGEI